MNSNSGIHHTRVIHTLFCVTSKIKMEKELMIAEVALLVGIYAIWLFLLVNAMVSSEEISLTVATLPFIVTFPIALILAAWIEVQIPGVFLVDVVLTMIIGVLIFVRWVMAIVGE